VPGNIYINFYGYPESISQDIVAWTKVTLTLIFLLLPAWQQEEEEEAGSELFVHIIIFVFHLNCLRTCSKKYTHTLLILVYNATIADGEHALHTTTKQFPPPSHKHLMNVTSATQVWFSITDILCIFLFFFKPTLLKSFAF